MTMRTIELAPLLLIMIAGTMAVAGCSDRTGDQWSFTVNGDASKCVNSSLFETFGNASTYSVLPDGSEVDGISLEIFLYNFGLYPVASISFAGTTYDWKTVVESIDEDALVLVEKDGSIYYNGTTAKVANVDVAVGEKTSASTLDVEPFMLNALGAGGRAVIFYVDALGYDRYADALQRGLAANMSSVGKPIKAMAVYPTITQVNAIAMMTGKGPDLAKGHFRSALPGNDTMSDILGREGIRCLWVDGTSAPVKLNGTVLNVDRNGDGSEDDEVADAAIKAYMDDAGLVVVHFSETDDVMHLHGPYSPEGLASVNATDALVGKVLHNLDKGTLVVIWGDHGCHPVPGGGNHGTLAGEDMYVPIITGYV
jgi:hypothetical protein